MKTIIPDWDNRGVLPPFLHAPTDTTGRTPYPVALTGVIERFATSLERIAILEGFLA